MSLFIPTFFKGTVSDVRKRCKRAIKQFAKGTSFVDVLEPERVDDALDGDSFVALNYGRAVISRPQDFQMSHLGFFVRDAELDDIISSETIDLIFDELIKYSWGVLLLHCRDSAQDLLRKPYRYVSFIEAANHFWPELSNSGARFTYGDDEPKPLWKASSGLQYALARAGVPNAALDNPPERISDLVPFPLNPALFVQYHDTHPLAERHQ